MKRKTVLIPLIVFILLSPFISLATPISDTNQTIYYKDSEKIPCSIEGGDFYGQDANYAFNPDYYSNEAILKGNINNDADVDLFDAILALQIMAGMETASNVYKEADVNEDGKIGLEEAIYTLQRLADIGESMLIKSSIPYNDSQTYDEENLRALINDFSDFTMDFYHELIKSENIYGKNIFFSTYSIENALAMTWAGAKNNTAKDMADVLHLNLPSATFHPTLNALNLDLNSRDDQLLPSGDAFHMNLVNAIWSRIGYPFLSSYLDLIAQNYNAGVRADRKSVV